jgi:hypothetical protein
MFRCILSYLTLPYWLYREAMSRKRKTGHALPVQALEDAEHSQVSAEAMARIRRLNEVEETAYGGTDVEGKGVEEKGIEGKGVTVESRG